MSAVIFLGDDFGFINAIGLVVLIFGAVLFNYSKYRKLVEKETRLGKSTGTLPLLPLIEDDKLMQSLAFPLQGQRLH